MKISIANLEAYLEKQYAGRVGEQSLFMKLVEELGEVAEILNKRSGRKPSEEMNFTAELGNELADMIHYIVAIAAVNEIDLNRIILEKDKTASIKYHREENLETFLLAEHK